MCYLVKVIVLVLLEQVQLFFFFYPEWKRKGCPKTKWCPKKKFLFDTKIMNMNSFFSGTPCTLEWANLLLVYINDFQLSENLHSPIWFLLYSQCCFAMLDVSSPYIVYNCELNQSWENKSCTCSHPNIQCLKNAEC